MPRASSAMMEIQLNALICLACERKIRICFRIIFFCINFAPMNKILTMLALLASAIYAPAQTYIECEDTCSHIHGIDLARTVL